MQSVNLYLPEYRPKKEWLSLQNCVFGFGLFLLLMVGMQVHRSMGLNELNARVASLQHEEQETKQKIEQIKSKVKSSDKVRLQQQAQALRAAIENRHAIKSVMAGNALGNQSGFSEHLYVLGEKRSTDLILNRITLSRGGQYVALAGTTKTPASVPHYIHHLQQAPAFSAAKFGFLTIDDRGGVAHFHLSGNAVAGPEALQLYRRPEAKQ